MWSIVVDRNFLWGSRSGSNWPFVSGSYLKLYTSWKIRFFTYSQQFQVTLFYFSHQCHRCHGCHNFQYFEQHIEIFLKKYFLHMVEMDTDPDQQALDAYSDPDPAKWCQSDRIRIRIHNTGQGMGNSERKSVGFNKITAVVAVSALLHRMRI